MDKWEVIGQQLLKGRKIEEIELDGKRFVFNPKQTEFICDFKSRYCLDSGGYGSGKSLALYIKLILFLKCFPKNRVLLGRKTLMDIERAMLPDLFDLMPSNWYKHRVKDAVININNGSQIILFGLDALQEGSLADIKKAQQKIKSLNLGAYFIDQLEEVEYGVFKALNSRLRRMDVPVRQGNMTCNPANFWAYHYFKLNKRKDSKDNWVDKQENDSSLIESSMLDNKEHLPDDYLEDQMNNDERYIKRYVYGKWTPDILTDKAVFAQEYIDKFEIIKKPPITEEEGCEIWEPYNSELQYQIGVDPSEGVIDPSSISVVSSEGKKVAKWNGKINIPAQIEKVKFLSFKYNNPLIVPECNAAGMALLEGIKDLKCYEREDIGYYSKLHSTKERKLGWKTSYQSKQALISHFQNLLRRGFPKIYDQKTIEELKTFVWSNSARQQGAGAQKGFHDDDVISTLLAFWGLNVSISRPPKQKNYFEERLKQIIKSKPIKSDI